MLKEIYCSKFISHGIERGRITFHKGLNTVLGPTKAENSIGKSTFLMVLDFVLGGEDYYAKTGDTIRNAQDHVICFAFEFEKTFWFARSTNEPSIVIPCDENYKPLEGDPLPLEDYRSFLSDKYGMDFYGLTFRGAISRFIRVYGRETLDEHAPLQSSKKESSEKQIHDFLKLNRSYETINEAYQFKEEMKKKASAFASAQNYQFIPKTNKSQLKECQKELEVLRNEASELLKSCADTKVLIDAKQKDRLVELEDQYSAHARNCADIQSQLKSIRLDNSKGKRTFQNDYKVLQQFFPGIDIQRISAIEDFHVKLSNILKDEVKEAEDKLTKALSREQKKVDEIDKEISTIGKNTNMPDDLMKRYATTTARIKHLEDLASFYNTKIQLTNEKKEAEDAYSTEVMNASASVEEKLNNKMKEINYFITQGRTAPKLSIEGTRYQFFTPNDIGTGSQHKGLIVFDLAMLELTHIPLVIHDSVLLKEIQDSSLEKILEEYQKQYKQVFIAIDKIVSYSQTVQQIIKDTLVIELSPDGNELFGRSWNMTEENEDNK